MAKNKYTNIGTVMKAKKDNPSDSDRFYIKLEQRRDKEKKLVGEPLFPIKLANGKVLNEGDTLALFSKPEQFKRRVAEGKMSEAKAEELSFLRFDVCLTEKLNDDGTPAKSDSDGDINF